MIDRFLSQAIKDAGIDVNGFLTVGVSAALRQLLEFGLFHGDPHPGNIFAMRDGRIAYVDFGNVAVLSQVLSFGFVDACLPNVWYMLSTLMDYISNRDLWFWLDYDIRLLLAYSFFFEGSSIILFAYSWILSKIKTKVMFQSATKSISSSMYNTHYVTESPQHSS